MVLKKTVCFIASLAMLATMAFSVVGNESLNVLAAEVTDGGEISEKEFLKMSRQNEMMHQEMKLEEKFYGTNGERGSSWDGTTVKVTIENVPNGYVEAYTPRYDVDGNVIKKYYKNGAGTTCEYTLTTFLPIGETVEVPKGALLQFEAYGLYALSGNQYYCDSFDIVKAGGVITEEYLRGSNIEMTEDMTIRPHFVEDTEEYMQQTEYYYAYVENSMAGSSGRISSKVHVCGYDENGVFHGDIPAILKLGPYRDNFYYKDKFAYDDSTKILSGNLNTNVLWCRVPFTATINGKEYVLDGYNGAYVSWGAQASVYIPSIIVDGTEYSYYSEGMDEIDEKDYPIYRSILNGCGEPTMYGYTFAGFTTNDSGNLVNLDSGIDWTGLGYGLVLNAVFKNAAGQVYTPPVVRGADTGNDGIVEGPAGTMYRLYNPNSGEHLYTADINETKYLASIGWNYENYAWQAPTSSNTPVYRVYNPNSGEHHYTSDTNEVSVLVSLGWNDEGIKFYSDDNQGTSMYRLYNPNATGQYEAGAHHYTKDVVERDYLTSIGWNAEGIGWYGL